LREILERTSYHFQSARVQIGQGVFALHQVKRCSFPGPRLSERQDAMRKIKYGQGGFADRLPVRFPPMQSSCDHEVQNQPETVLKAKHDSLSDAAQSYDLFPVKN